MAEIMKGDQMQDQNNQNNHDENKKAGHWLLAWLIGFFVVFASVDAYFVYTALSTHTGVVAENSYEVGLKYNDILQEAKRRAQDE